MVGRSVITVNCPNCGHEFDVQTRAALGEGTQKSANMSMNANRQAILDILNDSNNPLSVRDVHSRLLTKQVRRQSRKGTGWNYHTVQADLSNLVAMGRAEMIRPHEIEVYDEEEGHTTGGVPMYRGTLNNRDLENGGATQD